MDWKIKFITKSYIFNILKIMFLVKLNYYRSIATPRL